VDIAMDNTVIKLSLVVMIQHIKNINISFPISIYRIVEKNIKFFDILRYFYISRYF